MASKDIQDWQPEVRKYIKMPTANESLMDAEVLEICRDFLKETSLWKYDLARISIVADTEEYDFTAIDTDGNNVLVALDVAKYKEDGEDDDQFTDLEITTRETLERDKAASWQFEVADNPSSIYVTKEKKFRLYPIPENASSEGLLLHVVVMPANNATKVPLFVWDDHMRTISLGAASLLMGQTNKPWSNKELADRYWVEYTAKRDEATFQKWAGRTTRRMRVKPRNWAGSRSRFARY